MGGREDGRVFERVCERATTRLVRNNGNNCGGKFAMMSLI